MCVLCLVSMGVLTLMKLQMNLQVLCTHPSSQHRVRFTHHKSLGCPGILLSCLFIYQLALIFWRACGFRWCIVKRIPAYVFSNTVYIIQRFFRPSYGLNHRLNRSLASSDV